MYTGGPQQTIHAPSRGRLLGVQPCTTPQRYRQFQPLQTYLFQRTLFVSAPIRAVTQLRDEPRQKSAGLPPSPHGWTGRWYSYFAGVQCART